MDHLISGTVTYSGCLGDWCPSFGAKNAPVKFFFQFYFNKNYVEVAINDFTMHLIILKWVRRQNYRQKRSKRRTCLRKCFNSFNSPVTDEANVCYLF